jgi:hypothetical protein
MRLYSPAVGVTCDGRQSSADCRRRSHSRRVAPEYAYSGRDDEHCRVYEEEGNVAGLRNIRVAKADGKVTDSGSCACACAWTWTWTGNSKLLFLENNKINYKHFPSH